MRPTLLLLLAALIAAGCSTHAQSVCEKISFCRTLSTDQEHTCEANVKNLAQEASTSQCSPQYDAYFSCADDRYDCEGNVPSFPGCENARAALDDCLSAARANNACGNLSRALAACGEASPPAASEPLLPCGAAEICSADCYLQNVTDVCSPHPIELSGALQCAKQCTP